MSEKTVGYIGLGLMGRPMAKNLIDEGYDVVGYNRSTEPIQDVEAYGGLAGTSPADVASRCEVIHLCLPGTSEVEAVVLGGEEEPQPLIDGLSENSTVIDHSTISPTTTQEIGAKLDEMGVNFLDAPVSGGEIGAIDGTLSIMVGGKAAALSAHRDILEVLGETITHCGPVGSGQTTKACNQMIVAAQLAAISEALVYADQADANLEAVVEAVSGGAASSWALDNRAPDMIRGNFEPGFFAAYHYDDLNVATESADEVGAPIPVTSLVHELYKTMTQNDLGQDDTSGVMQVIEMMAGSAARIEPQ